MRSFRSFPVRLPSGVRYWTVVDVGYRPVPDVDEWLLHERLGRDLAESTTEAYATSVALFLEWCATVGLLWQGASAHLGRFMHWLRHYRRDEPVVLAGAPVRDARRVNAVLAAVREFLKHAVSVGTLPATALDALYDVVEDVGLPVEVRGEHGTRLRARPRHRLREPERVVDAASDEEVLALVRACLNARDRFVVLALWRAGLRRGELTGLRREDVHLVPDAARLGCGVKGAHLHVVRRPNPNGAAAKSRRRRAVPADWLVVQAYDAYVLERDAVLAGGSGDFVLVNLFRPPVGAPMRPGALNELFAELSRRAGLGRPMHPHMLRHAMATNVVAAGGTIDELKDLLGHAWLTSSEAYLHPSADRLRAAVDRVASPLVAVREQGR
ncbi:tyrosine-type recombinase/integrase [Parafrankia sp. FMc6]|uniref:tyrosine-type recombinase/integrase n=1 Tax=Parafrankia soli TaxID=2599596 RepID=UPI0034D77B15